jgi:uncharacterized protein YbbC (DUF1343 family)
MLNGEGWLDRKVKCKLTIIPILNYAHRTEYVLPVPPSPNLPDMDAVYLYPSICLFEGTHISLGRGTGKPFRLIGYPKFAERNPDHVTLKQFTPKSIPGVALHPPFEDTLCDGWDLSGKGYETVKKRQLNLHWLTAMYQLYPDQEYFFTPFFEKLAGTDQLRKQISNNESEEQIRSSWKPEIDRFKKIRKKYLIYPDFE